MSRQAEDIETAETAVEQKEESETCEEKASDRELTPDLDESAPEPVQEPPPKRVRTQKQVEQFERIRKRGPASYKQTAGEKHEVQKARRRETAAKKRAEQKAAAEAFKSDTAVKQLQNSELSSILTPFLELSKLQREEIAALRSLATAKNKRQVSVSGLESEEDSDEEPAPKRPKKATRGRPSDIIPVQRAKSAPPQPEPQNPPPPSRADPMASFMASLGY